MFFVSFNQNKKQEEKNLKENIVIIYSQLVLSLSLYKQQQNIHLNQSLNESFILTSFEQPIDFDPCGKCECNCFFFGFQNFPFEKMYHFQF